VELGKIGQIEQIVMLRCFYRVFLGHRLLEVRVNCIVSNDAMAVMGTAWIEGGLERI